MLYKTSKIDFSRFIFTIHYTGIHRTTRGCRELQGLQGVTGGYKGLQKVTGGYKRLQGVTSGHTKTCFLSRTFTNYFSFSILYKIKVAEISSS